MSRRKAPPSSSASSDEGRFPAGTTLGERYRVLGLLGRGDLGEVEGSPYISGYVDGCIAI